MAYESAPVSGSSSQRRLKVLAIAEHANPEWVSVPLVGWSTWAALRRVVDTHLVTHVRNQPALERAGLVEGKDFTSLDSEAVAGPLWKLAEMVRGGQGKGWTTLTALSVPSYLYFEWLLWRKFGPSLQRGEWDVVHRITPLSPTTPSPLAYGLRSAHVPFVIGPLNGGVPWPREFDSARRAEREWLSYVRQAYRFVPGYKITRSAASAIVLGSQDTLEQMDARYREKCIYIPENGVDLSRFRLPETRTTTLPLKLCFVGRLVPYKGADMLIEAITPLAQAGKVVLDIVGDGPERTSLEAQVAAAGLGRSVSLLGWVEHQAVGEHLRRADLFAFPSIREFGGGVVLEAMASGTPAMVVAYGGPRELVTPACGVSVPLGSRAQIVASFRHAIEDLVDHPNRVEELGRAARQRVLDWYTWDKKADQLYAVYEWVLGRGAKPDFGLPFPDLGPEVK